MTETHNAKYKFKEHILNLSHNKTNYDDALKEWAQMPELYKKLHKGVCKCICQHILKYYHFIHNKKTHKTITVGKECYKKFKFDNVNKYINEIYQNIINKYLQGEYENIGDVDDFSINIKHEIEKDLKDRYESNITNINVLNYLKTNIIELIEDYNFTDLEDLKNLVIQTITDLEQKKFKEEQIKQKLEEIKNINLKINEIQIINNKIILYNNNINKWKLIIEKEIREINETNDDYNKRIIYTKNGPLKIKDIILLSGTNIDKDIEQKIRQIEYIEDTNEEYTEMGKSWLVNYINYNEFINFDINTICDLNLEFYLLNTKTLQYLRDNQTELEFYIRYKLGQRIFPDNDYHGQKHLKFDFDEDIDFDSQDNEYRQKSSNKYIIELFNNFYNDNTVLIYTHKGAFCVRFININNQIIDTSYSGEGTVDILIEILKYEFKQIKFPEFIPDLDNVLILHINYIDYYLCEKTNNVFEINKDEYIGKFIGLYDTKLEQIIYI